MCQSHINIQLFWASIQNSCLFLKFCLFVWLVGFFLGAKLGPINNEPREFLNQQAHVWDSWTHRLSKKSNLLNDTDNKWSTPQRAQSAENLLIRFLSVCLCFCSVEREEREWKQKCPLYLLFLPVVTFPSLQRKY